MITRQARADVKMIRQETQYTCVAASISACLAAHGKDVTEAQVNRILGAEPMRGATWEDAMTVLQYFGMRGILVIPCTLAMLKEATDKGNPAIIGWNPEGRPWSHASVVHDVNDQFVHVMDPNCPDPNQTVRLVPHAEFHSKWSEKFGDVLIRRPALIVEREVTETGMQVRASTKRAGIDFATAFTRALAGIPDTRKSLLELQQKMQQFKDAKEQLVSSLETTAIRFGPDSEQTFKAQRKLDKLMYGPDRNLADRAERFAQNLSGTLRLMSDYLSRKDLARYRQITRDNAFQPNFVTQSLAMLDLIEEVCRRETSRKASTGLDCAFWKATDGNWYMELESWDEDGESGSGDYISYGPFNSEDAALHYLKRYFANPGGWSTDDSGTRKPPRTVVRPRFASLQPVNQIDHGWDNALSGGTDVMRRLVNSLRHEQGAEPLGTSNARLARRIARRHLAVKR